MGQKETLVLDYPVPILLMIGGKGWNQDIVRLKIVVDVGRGMHKLKCLSDLNRKMHKLPTKKCLLKASLRGRERRGEEKLHVKGGPSVLQDKGKKIGIHCLKNESNSPSRLNNNLKKTDNMLML